MSPLITTAILEKLPYSTNLDLEDIKGGSTKSWTSTSLMDDLREYLQRRENLSHLQIRSTGSGSNTQNYQKYSSSNKRQEYSRSSGAALAATSPPSSHNSDDEDIPMMAASYERKGFPPKNCVFCKRQGNHFSDDCNTMTSVKDRFDLVKKERRCVCCLRFNHQFKQDCHTKYKKCFYCSKTGHHRGLCQNRDSSKAYASRKQGKQNKPNPRFRGAIKPKRGNNLAHLSTIHETFEYEEDDRDREDWNQQDDPHVTKQSPKGRMKT
jgi:hypothetical protein